MASRIAARSTTAGTPVKSCISTRAGRNGDLALRTAAPTRQRRDIVRPDERRSLVAKQILQQDLQRVREPGDTELVFQAIQPKDLVVTVTDA